MRLHINSIEGKIYSNITLEEAGQQSCNTTNFIYINNHTNLA